MNKILFQIVAIIALIFFFTGCRAENKKIRINGIVKPIASVDAIYISKKGSDNNNGTESSPVESLEQAMKLANSEEKEAIIIREGNYRFNDLICNSNKKITIIAYPGERVVVSGTEEIATKWEHYNGNIWKTTPNIKLWQLFEDGEMLNIARTPNADCYIEDEDMTLAELENTGLWGGHNSWFQSTQASEEGVMVADKGFPQTNDSYEGAIAVLNVGAWQSTYSYVTSHEAGSNSFSYEKDLIWPYTGMFNYWQNMSQFYLEGKLELLDVNGEWHYDIKNNTLYVQCKDGGNPNRKKFSGKTQSYAIEIFDSKNITISGLEFRATTIYGENCDNISVKNCKFLYPSYSRRILRDIKGYDEKGGTDAKNNYIAVTSFNSCKNILFSNNIVKYSEGEALTLNIAASRKPIHSINSGATKIIGDAKAKKEQKKIDPYCGGWLNEYTNHSIENNLFINIDFSAANIHGIGSAIYMIGLGNSFVGNTVGTSGASETLIMDKGNYIANNEFYHTGLVQEDGAAIQMRGSAAAGTRIIGNWIHDTNKTSIRVDNSGVKFEYKLGRRVTATTINNNIIWNSAGICLKGDYHLTANNTLVGSARFGKNIIESSIRVFRNSNSAGSSYNKSVSDEENRRYYDSNAHTYIFNNLSEIIKIVEQGDLKLSPQTFNNYTNYYKGDKFVAELLMDFNNRDFRPINLTKQHSEEVSADVEGIVDRGVEPKLAYEMENFGMKYVHGKDSNPLDIGAVEYNTENYTIAGFCSASSSAPIPSDGNISSASNLMLAWKPAWRSSGSILYIGNSENGVERANKEDREYIGLLNVNCYYPAKNCFPFNESGNHYFWRVDCIVDGDVVKGEVWEFYYD